MSTIFQKGDPVRIDDGRIGYIVQRTLGLHRTTKEREARDYTVNVFGQGNVVVNPRRVSAFTPSGAVA